MKKFVNRNAKYGMMEDKWNNRIRKERICRDSKRTMELDLNEIRKNIDTIDTEMTRLFEERMKLTYQVAAYKIENGKKVYDIEREDSNLEHLSGLTEDSFNKQAIRELFSQIMSISRRKQYTLVKHE